MDDACACQSTRRELVATDSRGQGRLAGANGPPTGLGLGAKCTVETIAGHQRSETLANRRSTAKVEPHHGSRPHCLTVDFSIKVYQTKIAKKKYIYPRSRRLFPYHQVVLKDKCYFRAKANP